MRNGLANSFDWIIFAEYYHFVFHFYQIARMHQAQSMSGCKNKYFQLQSEGDAYFHVVAAGYVINCHMKPIKQPHFATKVTFIATHVAELFATQVQKTSKIFVEILLRQIKSVRTQHSKCANYFSTPNTA